MNSIKGSQKKRIQGLDSQRTAIHPRLPPIPQSLLRPSARINLQRHLPVLRQENPPLRQKRFQKDGARAAPQGGGSPAQIEGFQSPPAVPFPLQKPLMAKPGFGQISLILFDLLGRGGNLFVKIAIIAFVTAEGIVNVQGLDAIHYQFISPSFPNMAIVPVGFRLKTTVGLKKKMIILVA